MWSILLSYLPIVAAPLLATGLLVTLQRWVRPSAQPAAAPQPSAGSVPVPVTGTQPAELTWADIARQVNPLVAYVLPVLTSAIVIFLYLWPLAYLGWAAIRLAHEPGWSTQVPPWFGNPGYFLGFSFAGFGIVLVGGGAIAMLAFGLHAIGKCMLWPQFCDCDPPDCADQETDNRADP